MIITQHGALQDDIIISTSDHWPSKTTSKHELKGFHEYQARQKRM